MKRTGFMNEVQIDKLDEEDKQQSESKADAPSEASSDGVDEVPLHHPEPKPEPEPKPKPHDIRQGPRVLVIPREPEVEAEYPVIC